MGDLLPKRGRVSRDVIYERALSRTVLVVWAHMNERLPVTSLSGSMPCATLDVMRGWRAYGAEQAGTDGRGALVLQIFPKTE